MGFFQDSEIVVSTVGKRSSKYNEPVLIVSCTKSKFRINSIASELLNVGHRENVVFINNGKTGDDRVWGILKGFPVLDETGEEVMVSDRLTAAEKAKEISKGNYTTSEDGTKIAIAPMSVKLAGSRASAVTKTAIRGDKGHTLEFTENNVWREIDGDVDYNHIFVISAPELVKIPGADGEQMVFPIVYKTKEVKSERDMD